MPLLQLMMQLILVIVNRTWGLKIGKMVNGKKIEKDTECIGCHIYTTSAILLIFTTGLLQM